MLLMCTSIFEVTYGKGSVHRCLQTHNLVKVTCCLPPGSGVVIRHYRDCGAGRYARFFDVDFWHGSMQRLGYSHLALHADTKKREKQDLAHFVQQRVAMHATDCVCKRRNGKLKKYLK